jgi:hypothetical protein
MERLERLQPIHSINYARTIPAIMHQNGFPANLFLPGKKLTAGLSELYQLIVRTFTRGRPYIVPVRTTVSTTRGEMKIRKTKLVAVLTQTLTTTSTFTSTSPRYAPATDLSDFAKGEVDPIISIVTRSAGPIQRWCGECATPIVMMPPELAATFCSQTPRAIYRLVEAGSIHFTEGPEGVMVCPASLMKTGTGSERSLLDIERPLQMLPSIAVNDRDRT